MRSRAPSRPAPTPTPTGAETVRAKKKWGPLAFALWSLGFAVASFTIGAPVREAAFNSIFGQLVALWGEQWAEANVLLLAAVYFGGPLVLSAGLGLLVVILRNKFVLQGQTARPSKSYRERRPSTGGVADEGTVNGRVAGWRRISLLGLAGALVLFGTLVQLAPALAALVAGLLAVAHLLGLEALVTNDPNASHDDTKLAHQQGIDDAIFSLLMPIDFVALLLFGLAWLMHYLSNKYDLAPNWLSLTGFVLALVSFVASFFKVSFGLSLFGLSIGAVGFNSQSDMRYPTGDEYTISDIQLIGYVGSIGGEFQRVSGTATNSSPDNWQNATITLSLTDADGNVCLTRDQDVEYVAVGQSVEFSTPKFRVDENGGAACTPTGVRGAVTRYDVDSLSAPNPSSYERPERPTFSALAVQEDEAFPGMLSDTVSVRVAGTVAAERAEGSGKLSFEIADYTGARLDQCFRAEPGPDGAFETRAFHTPVDRGVYVTAIAVEDCG